MDQLRKAFEETLKVTDNAALSTSLKCPADGSLNEIQQAEYHQWLTVSQRFDEASNIDKLNDTLRSRTYLLETQEPSHADCIVLARMTPVIKSWAASNDEQFKTYRHIARWADLVQNVLGLEGDAKIKINLDLDVPRETKQKPKKGDKADAKGEKKAADAKGDKVATPEAAAPIAAAQGAAPPKDGKKKEKKPKVKKPQPEKKEVPITPGMIDLRVGFIEKAIKHPDADSLYVSTIQMGDEDGATRTVCSGLVKHFTLEQMQKRYVVVVANLKPVTMRGIKSCAMVLCASDASDGKVEFVNPPEGSQPGDKLFFETYDIDPEAVLNPKKKIWETIQPGFKTNDKLEVTYRKDETEEPKRLVNKKGELCHVESLVDAPCR